MTSHDAIDTTPTRQSPDQPAGDGPLAVDRRTFLRRAGAAAAALSVLGPSALAQMNHSHDHGDGGMPGGGMEGRGMGGGMSGGGMSGGGMHDHGAMGGEGPLRGGDIGPMVLAPAAIPWSDGRCDFCGMTLATPPMGNLPAGFREATYAQIRFMDGAGPDGRDALHFESIACMHDRAWVDGLVDGHGVTFHVADYARPPHGGGPLLLGRDAHYLWSERLQVSMNARLAAFSSRAAVASGLARLAEAGEETGGEGTDYGAFREMDASLLADVAPLPIVNLVALLARHSGLMGS